MKKTIYSKKGQENMRVMGATGDGVRMTEMPRPMPGSGRVRVKIIASGG